MVCSIFCNKVFFWGGGVEGCEGTFRENRQFLLLVCGADPQFRISLHVFVVDISCLGGMRWRSWLRHCATSRKVAGSIPDGVIGIFHWHNPFGRTMALGSTQPLTEMSTRNVSWGGKGGRYVGLTTLPPSCADCFEIWEPQPPGTLRACPGL